MPKKAYKIEDFSGGINQLADPRDIEDNQFEELFNADVSRKGRITIPGNALKGYHSTNTENVSVSPQVTTGITNVNNGLTPGYGLFAFSHDYNMKSLLPGTEDLFEPLEQDTEFLCINDGAHIDIWDSCHDAAGQAILLHSLVKLGEAHEADNGKKVKPTYYKAGDGLRVCDANFGEKKIEASLAEALDATEVGVDVANGSLYIAGEYIKINAEVMKVLSISTNTLTVIRGQFGTIALEHSTGADIYRINVPKILTHIHRPMLEKAEAKVSINRWVEDLQMPEAPQKDALMVYHNTILGVDSARTTLTTGTLYPSGPEIVNIGIGQNDATQTIMTLHETLVAAENTDTETILTITIADPDSASTALDFSAQGGGFNPSIGMAVVIENCTGAGVVLNGVHEIVGFGSSAGQLKILCEEPTSAYTPDTTSGAENSITVRLEDSLMSDDLKNEYILGMSYLYGAGGESMQESSITVGHSKESWDNYKISDSFHAANGGPLPGWRTIANDLSSSEAALPTNGSASNNWQYTNHKIRRVSSTTASWLFFESTSGTVETSTTYTVVLWDVYGMSTSDELVVYIGIGPDEDDFTGLDEGVGKYTLSAAAGNGDHQFTITTGSSVDPDVFIAIKGTGIDFSIGGASVWKQETSKVMSADNSIDLRGAVHAPQASLTFLCNNSRTVAAQNNSWNERIEGFRIYMKQIDAIGGGLSDDWLLLYDANIKDGTYICHSTDSDTQNLQLSNISSNEWNATDSATDAKALVTSKLTLDPVRQIPLLTYESENGYSADTNLGVMYKTSAMVQRKVYAGNLKIGNRLYPDRMIRADADRFDTFPDDDAHYIDVATSDGDSIVKLESFGDKLLQFKKKTAYLLKITSEGEELEETWSGAGVLSPSQVTKTNNGVIWVNANGLYLYDGEKLNQVTEDRFKSTEWAVNENEETPILVGYDENSNKVIIQTLNNSGTDSGGFIYDLSEGAIIQCQKLFNWYTASTDNTTNPVNNDPRVAPPQVVNPGEGPLT